MGKTILCGQRTVFPKPLFKKAEAEREKGKKRSNVPQLQGMMIGSGHEKDFCSFVCRFYSVLNELDISYSNIKEMPQALLNMKNVRISMEGLSIE
ncbi:MAG: hypothetical protein IJ662_01695 [Clostridia bacterium]|nr:hypothetical protein [Clostridia bacterium]